MGVHATEGIRYAVMRWKSILTTVVSTALLSSPIWIPHLLWRIAPLTRLRLLVVDYTVPDDAYRNHLGLIWLLNHLKVTNRFKARTWREETDYVGFIPGMINGETRISEVNLLQYDWIYVVDTYGVWVGDSMEKTTAVTRSDETAKLVFGGLSMKDVEDLTYFANHQKNVILEFNAFDEPTKQGPREAAEKLMGVVSTGWAGCFIPSLSDSTSFPEWMPRLYSSRYPGQSLPSGPAMLFIHRDGRLLLLHGEPFERTMPSLLVTKAGKERFPEVLGTPPYFGWFSIVTPEMGVVTLAEIRLPTPPDWKKRLAQFHIPESFALLTLKRTQGSYRYYLAANLSNMDEIPQVYRMAGLPRLEAAVHRRRDSFNYGPAYWQFLFPVMSDILKKAALETPGPKEAR